MCFAPFDALWIQSVKRANIPNIVKAPIVMHKSFGFQHFSFVDRQVIGAQN
jgi:hypothetical protein